MPVRFMKCFAWALAVILPAAAAVADTAWTTQHGTTQISVYGDQLETLGISIDKGSPAATSPGLQVIELPCDAAAPITFTTKVNAFSEFADSKLHHLESLVIRSGQATVLLPNFVVAIAAGSEADSFAAAVIDPATGDVLLHLTQAKAGLNRVDDEIKIEGAGLVIAEALAARLQQPALAGRELGNLSIRAAIAWAGGEEPVAVEPFEQTVPSDPAAPRGGNGGTVCPQPVGPDIIVGEISGIGNYDAFQWPASSGNFIEAFSVGTTSCNIGNLPVLWDDDQPAPSNLHPAIAQNIYRLQTLPNGTTRFEQIGQSWLKHGFTVASGNACGCGCTNGVSFELRPGCSDPYGPSLNGSHTYLGPRWQVNARTSVYPHPYQDGTALPGGTSIFKRLQIKTTDLGTPNSLYFSEGHYVAPDDHQAGNASNNASYRQATFTGSGSVWTGSNVGATVRELPAIRAWKTNVATVVETDIVIQPPTGDPFPNAHELFILAANAVELPDGFWAYEYALYNMHSHQAARSFSVPVVPGATIRNVEFHDVDYHSGEPFSGTDWSWAEAGGKLTWSTETFAANPNANALRWGTLYNFRFEANLSPDPNGGSVDVGLFRNDPNWPTSVSAATIAPLGSAVLISLPEGTSQLYQNCVENTLLVEIQDGAETYVPGSARLHFSTQGVEGPFTQHPLTDLGDNLYEATFPSLSCDDSVNFFLTAEGSQGSVSAMPPAALTNDAYFSAEVGFEEVVTLLDENFENGLGDGWVATGMWNVTGLCPVTPMCATTGNNWAYYGLVETCTFNNGLVHSGSLSRTINIPQGENIQLTYCSAFQRHAFPNGDMPELKINGVNVDLPAAGLDGGVPPVWETRTVDLNAYAGQTITLSFHFYNLVAVSDDYLGWQIDDVRITAQVVSCIPTCACGDMNVDGTTDGKDLQAFVNAVLLESTLPADLQGGDFNGDAVVNLNDADAMVDALLNGCGG